MTLVTPKGSAGGPSDDPVSSLAKERFGITCLYPYQRFVIAGVLDAVATHEAAGKALAIFGAPPEDALEEQRSSPGRQIVILPTGAGKSLCFQLPSLLCPGPSLIVFPLLGLMADQERRLTERNIACAVFRGGMSEPEKTAAMESVRAGSARVILCNPEILSVPSVLEFLKTVHIFHFVIDEAHCVSEWGDTFRPAYLDLSVAIKALEPRVITAFTATASPTVLHRVAQSLFDEEPYTLIQGNPDRPNIRYSVKRSVSMKQAFRNAVRNGQRPMIVFASSRPGVQLLAEDLIQSLPSIDTRFYHAGLEREEKQRIEKWFMASEDGVLCATCAYGMGMDKPNIRTIVHVHPPSSVEAYLQEAGRAGRDGKPAQAILLTLPAPRIHQVSRTSSAAMAEEKKSEARTPEDRTRPETSDNRDSMAAARKRIMLDYAGQDKRCRREMLLGALGVVGETCAGCDVCEDMADADADGHQEIICALRRHPRRFTSLQASQFLRGAAHCGRANGFAVLGHWQQDEVEEALANELRLAYLVRRVRLPWKGALEVVKESSLKNPLSPFAHARL